MQALPRIAGMTQGDGLFVESLVAAIAQDDPGAKARMQEFLSGKAAKVRRSSGSKPQGNSQGAKK